MLYILLILFLMVFLTFFMLPYSIRMILEKESDAILYAVYVRSWQNLLSIEWIKKDDQQYIRLKLIKICIQKKIGLLDLVEKDQIDKQLKPQKKNRIKQRRMYCTIANTVIDSPRLLLQFIRIFHLKLFEISGHFGTNDPAYTGIAYGLMQSLYLLNWNRIHVSVTPDFHEKICEGSINLMFHFMFFRFLWWLMHAGIRFLWISGRCHFKMKGRLAW
ncbi:MAG: DUF2953 domain-containing protein [bacterium]|nr:MAG: DUF2953 domain-containing protein [bacterium]